MIELPAESGLTGSFQVHVAPLVLVEDERAHQVFLGFAVHWDAFAPFLEANTQVFSDGRWTSAENLQPADFVIIPRRQDLHPGGVEGLVWVVDRLLGPGGCPWDQAQTHESLKRHLLEEVYELFEAIDRRNDAGLKEELGDVLLQPIMHGQMANRDGKFSTRDVAQAITDKLIRRHPHVFSDRDVADADEVLRNWDAIKRQERGDAPKSILEGVPKTLPALLRALEVSKRAARAGFEWPNLDGVWEKFEEESAEVRAAIATHNQQDVASEIGDLLFTVVNLARWLKVDPEDALRQMVDRFQARFESMEAASEVPLGELSAEEWDELWRTAKRQTAG